MVEEWKPVKGFEGCYEISNLGRVRSLPRPYCKGRVLKPKKMKIGYNSVNLSKNSVKTTLYIHRLVASHFIDNPDKKLEVNHKDGDKTNNNVDNLEWVSSSENTQHAYDTGLIPRTTKPFSKKARANMGKVKGKDHYMFKGYYHTPYGVFESSKQASKVIGCGKNTVASRCKNPRFKDYYFVDKECVEE